MIYKWASALLNELNVGIHNFVRKSNIDKSKQIIALEGLLSAN